MMKYLQFFFGTRVRAITSLVLFGIFGIMSVFYPELVSKAISRSLNAILTGILVVIGPLIQPILTIAIVVAGIRYITRSVRPSKKP